MTISHIALIADSVSGSPVVDCRVETVSTTTGLPSGTLFGTNSNGSSGTVTAGAAVVVALTTPVVVARGQLVAIKIAYTSGTSIALSRVANFKPDVPKSLPYGAQSTGTPAKFTPDSLYCLAVGSSSTVFYQIEGIFIVTAAANNDFNNTNSARRGLRFTAPFNCRCAGIKWFNNGRAGDFNVTLYNDAGTELSSSSTAFDGDTNLQGGGSLIEAYFDNPVTLTAGTTYRAVIEPTTSTNITLSTLTLPNANHRSSVAMGTGAHYTTFASAAWDDTATGVIPLLDVLIDQIDDGAGGGATVIGVIGG